ncbi:MAG: protein-L-isoaspartate(D-aspartate) O-methyltransferase [Candidatus Aminicenantes bacterium]|nr:protein-L-isoaspartate(D-aspartate) O-methyltransferase [Candidatus Aminicenantes bacterium]
MDEDYEAQRRAMVDGQLRNRGIRSEAVLRAMAKVPRERFVPEAERRLSYINGPLPIGFGQTISQPYIVAYMTEALELRGDENVLEIGTGSGYQTAVLAEIAARVYSLEVIPELSRAAADLLTNGFNYRNISFKIGRGQEGWPEFAPYERMILTAAPGRFPEPLFEQLAEGGIVIAPVGGDIQRLVRYEKRAGKITADELIGVVFVPLI